MTLNQMKYFVTVAECLSFTEAAKCLFVTQPALSRQISAMEAELGTKLFVRDKKRLKLTPGGLVLYNRWPKIMTEYAETVREARTANQGFEGKLRIGFLDIYDISEIFTDVLIAFREKYANIQLSLERFPLGELPIKLYEGELDLILTYGFSLYDQPDLVTVNVQKYDSYLMINQRHPLAGQKEVDLADFRDERFILLSPDVCEEGYQYIRTLFSRSNIHPLTQEVKKMEDIMLWVQTGDGVAITTNRTIEKQNPWVVLRPIQLEEAHGHDITMGWGKNNYNPAIAIFMELMEQMVSVSKTEDPSKVKRFGGKSQENINIRKEK